MSRIDCVLPRDLSMANAEPLHAYQSAWLSEGPAFRTYALASFLIVVTLRTVIGISSAFSSRPPGIVV
jgi:hypothetical protein